MCLANLLAGEIASKTGGRMLSVGWNMGPLSSKRFSWCIKAAKSKETT